MRQMRDVRRLLVVLATTLAVSSLAETVSAQSDPNARNTTGRPVSIAPTSDGKELSSDALWKRIRQAALPDLKYSEALANNIGTPRAKARAKCYAALVTANEQANGTGVLVDGKPLGDPPNPHLITDFEQAAEILDNLAPDSPVMLGCAEGAALVRQTVTQFISALISGAAILPKVPVL
jgi:hypothetical protein